ncbi:STAS domain-containing protein [Pontibacter sp. G13]|uniref:STAS domain-containing protein n=1 Tax=Pontibacter sp. G13 TaxID=3074898 RepID=UPI002889AD48|nr:STAS domain-containing protein [Pontibacter sp. G13]WNJ21200.1 STAS domain-containing protein [Pontibacter sp. G13]
MQILETQHTQYTTLSPSGDLDANSSVFLDEKISGLLQEGHANIHIDGSGITYISSAGLGVFISHLKEIEGKGGKFVLTHLSENVHDVFTILGLTKLDALVILDDATAVEKEF